jgi:hypothetical protein
MTRQQYSLTTTTTTIIHPSITIASDKHHHYHDTLPFRRQRLSLTSVTRLSTAFLSCWLLRSWKAAMPAA